MKNLTKNLLRFGAITLTLGAFTIARADTQNEKGDAGHLKDTAEVFDCKKDKWMGSHSSSTDCDMICIYWSGGPFKIECDSGGAFDSAIAVFRSDGTCYAIEDSHASSTKETMTLPNLPKGVCYIYAGYYNFQAYRNMSDYNGMSSPYASTDPVSGVGSSGPLYGCRVNGAPSSSYEVCFQPGENWEHVGVPFKADATCGKTKGSSDSKGNNKYNDSGSGQEFKSMNKGKKAKCFFQCKNESTNRGATGINISGVSKKKYKSKYIDVTGGGNITADIKKGDFCKNYNSSQKQIIKCIFKAKGAQKRKPNGVDTCNFRCDSGDGTFTDRSRCRLYTNLKK